MITIQVASVQFGNERISEAGQINLTQHPKFGLKLEMNVRGMNSMSLALDRVAAKLLAESLLIMLSGGK